MGFIYAEASSFLALRGGLINGGGFSGIMGMMRLLLLFFLFSATALVSLAEGAPAVWVGKGIKVQLVSDRQVITPGSTFHLGLWIQHDPGYHTYWQNPGLAGVPTKLAPELPPGFTAGAILYPPPNKVKMAGIRVHGYEHDVLIALPITAPADLAAGPVTLPVLATWMCCHRTCNPGHAPLSLTLTAGAAAMPDEKWSPQFAKLRSAQPPALADWTAVARRTGAEVELTLTPSSSRLLPPLPQFFSSDNLICSHPVQAWETVGKGYRVKLTLSDFLPADQTMLRGVLYSSGSWLPGRTVPYVAVALPLNPEAK